MTSLAHRGHACSSVSRSLWQQERQISAHHEPEICHAVPGVQNSDGYPGRSGQDPHRGESGLIEPQQVQK